MKRSLMITLVLVFVLGIAGTAFAATSPFEDVPAKPLTNWPRPVLLMGMAMELFRVTAH